MKKYKYIKLGIITFNILLILEWGINLSSLILIIGIWAIYEVKILKQISAIKNKKWISIIYKIYKTSIIILVTSFLIVESMIVLNINQTKDVKLFNDIEYIVVLGAAINDEKVSKTLQSRLDKALEYYNKDNSIKIIVSGGQGKDEIISEAEAMYRYLIDKGVDSKQIIKEDKSTTTLENILYSKNFLKEKENILIVTNDYHLFRARVIAYILGIENEGISSKSSLSGRLYYMVREYPTMLIDLVRTTTIRVSEYI